ncbi:MAG: HD domain-containing protein [Candidatus Omnitrophica bacterium]|nr:HD domain-containing protein [Candidatus Omnitrophota bacterium]
MRFKFKITSFQNTSILRKFTILYFLISIVPVLMLWFLYLQFLDHGQITITQERFSMILIMVVLGVGVGFVALRSLLIGVIDLTQKNRNAIESILGPEAIPHIADGGNEIAVLAQSFNEITSHLEENVRNLELAQKTLHSVLARVGEGISSMENIDSFLNLIVETMTEAMQAKMGILLLLDEGKKEMLVKASYGKKFNGSKARGTLKDGIVQSVIDSKKPMIINEIDSKDNFASILEAPVILAPLMLHDDVLGVLAVCGHKVGQVFTTEDENLMNNLALQTAVAIENSKLNDDAEKTYFETISALALAVEAKDNYSRGHLDRVAQYSTQIANELNLSAEDINTLRDAARLHDIGKIGITDDILKKQSPLNVQEREMMNKHCEIGEGIIKPIRSLRNLCDVVRHHHEKLDGSGYPDGLKGEGIHLLARILAIADIYDAITTSRSYRTAMTKEKAIEVMRGMKGQIDQKIVEILVKTLS